MLRAPHGWQAAATAGGWRPGPAPAASGRRPPPAPRRPPRRSCGGHPELKPRQYWAHKSEEGLNPAIQRPEDDYWPGHKQRLDVKPIRDGSGGMYAAMGQRLRTEGYSDAKRDGWRAKGSRPRERTVPGEQKPYLDKYGYEKVIEEDEEVYRPYLNARIYDRPLDAARKVMPKTMSDVTYGFQGPQGDGRSVFTNQSGFWGEIKPDHAGGLEPTEIDPNKPLPVANPPKLLTSRAQAARLRAEAAAEVAADKGNDWEVSVTGLRRPKAKSHSERAVEFLATTQEPFADTTGRIFGTTGAIIIGIISLIGLLIFYERKPGMFMFLCLFGTGAWISGYSFTDVGRLA